MSEINNGGPAFPETRWDDHTRQEIQWMGMSLRDYFAAKAMQAILTGPGARDGAGMKEWLDVPKFAYEIADIMLKERNK